MKTVSCRIFRAILEVLERREVSLAELAVRLPVPLSQIRDPRQRLSWSDAMTVLHEVGRSVGGPDQLQHIGEGIIYAPSFERVTLIMSQLADAYQLFRVLRLWLGPSLVPVIQRAYEEREDGSIVFGMHLPADVRGGLEYMYLSLGLYRHLPSLIGAPDARVEYRMEDGRAEYVIVPPEPDPQRNERLRLDGAARIAADAIRELIEQQHEIQRGWEAQADVIAALNERTRRMEVFSRTGQRLAQHIELSQLVEVLLLLLLQEFGFAGGTITMGIGQPHAQRWGMGTRDGDPAVQYSFTSHAGGRSQCRLELWGEPVYAVGSDDDPVAMLMPWMQLALDNALAFLSLDTERRRSEQRLTELESARRDIEQRDRQYRMLFEDASDAIAIADFETTAFVDVNKAMCAIVGYTREELLGLSITDVVLPDDLARMPLDNQTIRAGGTVRRTRQLITRAGEIVTVEVVAKLLFNDRVQLIARDVSRWKRAQEQLRESEERYALAVRGANDGLWDWNLRTSDIYFSPRWYQMLGLPEQPTRKPAPDDWLERVHPDDLNLLGEQMRMHLDGHTSHFSVEHRMQHQDGTWRWMLARGIAIREDGVAYRMSGSQTDITETKEAEARLYFLAYHDSLTRLPNRAYLRDALEELIERARTEPVRFAVLYLDLDRFKVINDSLGHTLGDRLLMFIAERLKNVVGDDALIARIGGDEFVLVIRDLELDEHAVHLADRLLAALERPFNVDGREMFLSCSVGVAYGHQRPYDAPDEIMRDADIAMYHAKARGKSRVEIFSQELHDAAVRRMRLETDLRRAIDQGRLALYYQPVIRASDGALVGVEALCRWKHDGTFISPAEFIPLAEETGIIHSLGAWATAEAAAQLIRWRERFPDQTREFTVSVNLSPRQFRRADIVSEVARITRRHALPPGSLTLEITESALIEDSDASIERIQEFKSRGVRVVIDDFGVGYSSFNYLVRLPIDAIKIDRSFITNLEHDDSQQKVVAAIVQLARNLNLQVVAEGVETTGQRDHLAALSPTIVMQGSLYAMPLPADELDRFFRPLEAAAPLTHAEPHGP